MAAHAVCLQKRLKWLSGRHRSSAAEQQ
jgi:hypothetical protein